MRHLLDKAALRTRVLSFRTTLTAVVCLGCLTINAYSDVPFCLCEFVCSWWS